jgi:hypothetical protein
MAGLGRDSSGEGRHKLLFEGRCCIRDGSIGKHRRRVAPLRLLPIKHSQVPKYAPALAAARLQGKLVVQLSCDKMFVVPVLDNPFV